MAKTETVKEKYVTGKGELTGFLSIIQPSRQYDNYQACILLDKKEGEELTTKLTGLRKQQWELEGRKGKLVDLPVKPYTVQDSETGEETADPQGRYILKTGSKGHTQKGEVLPRPAVFNAKKQPITGKVNIGEGTIARLAVVFSGYKAPIGVGVAAKLKSCQIIDLVEYASGFGADDFDEEEGFDGVGEEFTVEETNTPAVRADEEEEEEEF